jgi:hypothetical protein
MPQLVEMQVIPGERTDLERLALAELQPGDVGALIPEEAFATETIVNSVKI